jgi:hypothetical protein
VNRDTNNSIFTSEDSKANGIAAIVAIHQFALLKVDATTYFCIHRWARALSCVICAAFAGNKKSNNAIGK